MNILLVDDDKNIRHSLQRFLQELGHNPTACASGDEGLQIFSTGDFPLVISDVKMPGISGIELLQAIRALRPETDVVLITAHDDTALAVTALKAGAHDYLLKPINVEELAALIERVAEHQYLRRDNRALRENLDMQVQDVAADAYQEISRLRQLVNQAAGLEQIGIFSLAMKQVFSQTEAYHADRSLPVLIEGETGTGKEIAARFIHYGQSQPDLAAPFVAINCAALTASLFESELFGYEAGSFTGSLQKGQKGKLDLAAGGTLFLDEIGDMPLELQSKLLRVLQEKEFYRVGGLKKISTNIRLLCATNVDLAAKAADGSFRRDLYYRLSVGRIFLPPLRQRKEEILPLALLFLQRIASEKKKRFCQINAATAQLLTTYNWPGNVRELRNTIELATALYDDTELLPKHIIFPAAQQYPTASTAFAAPPSTLPLNPAEFSLPDQGFSLPDYTDKILAAALSKHKGNKSAAAQYLGISRRMFTYRLQKEQ